MKKLLGIAVLVLLLNNSSIADIEYSKNFSNNKADRLFFKEDVNYFIDQGYKLIIQETRGTRTAWVLKRGKHYIGCRTESLSREETCYLIKLVKE